MEEETQPCPTCKHCRLAASTSSPIVTHEIVLEASRYVGDFVASRLKVLACAPSPRSVFDAPTQPLIGIAPYFSRICTYSKCTPESVLGALIVLRQVTEESNSVTITNFNAHRLLVTAVMVYAKYYDDEIDPNARWARIAGVPVNELNTLEVDFLNLCQFNLHIDYDRFHECLHEVLNLHHDGPAVPCTCTEGGPLFAAPISSSCRRPNSQPDTHPLQVLAPQRPPSRDQISVDNESTSSHDSQHHKKRSLALLMAMFHHKHHGHGHHHHQHAQGSTMSSNSVHLDHHNSHPSTQRSTTNHNDTSEVASRISSSTAEHCLVFHPETSNVIVTSPMSNDGKARMPRNSSNHSLSMLLHSLSPRLHSSNGQQSSKPHKGHKSVEPQLVK